MDRAALKQKGKAAYKKNMLPCMLAAIVMAFFVEGTISFPTVSSYTTDYTTEAVTDTETAAGTESILETADGAAADTELISDTESSVSEESALSEEEETALMQQMYRELFRQAVMMLGIFLPTGLGAFITMFISGFGSLATFVILLAGNVFEVGCKGFYVQNLEEERTGFKTILCNFKKGKYWKTVMTGLYRALYIVLFGFLLIVPGVIKAYDYYLVPYLLAENTSMTEKEILRKSRDMMAGHRKEAFLLDLSFIGWDILSILTLGVLGVFYVNPYKYSSRAAFFIELRGPKAGSRRGSYVYTSTGGRPGSLGVPGNNGKLYKPKK